MIIAGVLFIPGSLLNHEFTGLNLAQIPAQSWFALIYLILFGSIAAFSAYVWLLKVRSATQVSTYAYVNPVIAVILGVIFAGEHITLLQITGLVVILGSVLLINLAKYRNKKSAPHVERSGVAVLEEEQNS
jgi:drug/metabolite transporter (DMT)-like permease